MSSLSINTVTSLNIACVKWVKNADISSCLSLETEACRLSKAEVLVYVGASEMKDSIVSIKMDLTLLIHNKNNKSIYLLDLVGDWSWSHLADGIHWEQIHCIVRRVDRVHRAFFELFLSFPSNISCSQLTS